jgi:DNA-binding response OmpR family regulator
MKTENTRILAVDDDNSILFLIREALELESYQVITPSNGIAPIKAFD